MLTSPLHFLIFDPCSLLFLSTSSVVVLLCLWIYAGVILFIVWHPYLHMPPCSLTIWWYYLYGFYGWILPISFMFRFPLIPSYWRLYLSPFSWFPFSLDCITASILLSNLFGCILLFFFFCNMLFLHFLTNSPKSLLRSPNSRNLRSPEDLLNSRMSETHEGGSKTLASTLGPIVSRLDLTPL